MTLNEILQKRGEAIEKMRAINDKVIAESRDFTDDENTQYEKHDAEQVSLKAQADRMQSLDALEISNNTPDQLAVSAMLGDDDDVQNPRATKHYKKSFRNWMQMGSQATPEIRNALQVGTDAEGGFIVPESYEARLVEKLQENNIMRMIANVVPMSSDRNIPIEATLGVATWTAEEAAYTESDAAFGNKTLSAYKLARIMKVSEELLMDSIFDLEAYIAANYGRSFGIAEEAAFVNGDGSGKPTGVVVDSTLGLTAASATAITTDEVIDLFHSLKRIYRRGATFLANDTTIKLIRKLKDGDSQYLWAPGLIADEPDRILARPIFASDGMPAATAGLKSMIFGDMSYYWIADRAGRTMQRLGELYAANGQVGFKMHERVDGKLTLTEAVKHLIML